MSFLHILLAIAVMAFWGFNFVAIHLGLENFPPLLFCTGRFFFASVPMIFFLKRPDIPFSIILRYGLLTFALQYILLFFGMQLGMPAGLASLLYQSQVFFTIGLAAFFFREKPTWSQLLGIGVGFIGIAVIASHLGGDVTFLGFLLTVAGALTWSVSNIISKKAGSVNMISLVVWGNAVSCPPLLLLSLWQEKTIIFSDAFHISWVSVLSMLYVAYVGTVFCFSIWSSLIHRYPVSKVVPFTLLVPVFGMLSSALLLNETLTWWKVLAAFIIMSGLIINVFGEQIKSKNKKEKENNIDEAELLKGLTARKAHADEIITIKHSREFEHHE